jgi:putative membrane-bound dehydrogenase-like protein
MGNERPFVVSLGRPPRAAGKSFRFLFGLVVGGFGVLAGTLLAADANRLTYLDASDPFYAGLDLPKLTTPQWVGEAGVEGIVILAVDDMSDPGKYEVFLRPLLERLKQIDGRAPVSIMCTSLKPEDPQLTAWRQEGLSLEAHTLTHPCPILASNDFGAAAQTFLGSIDLLNQIPGNTACAFRTPCCDSLNSPSPRLFAELFNRTTSSGKFLTIDSSVMNILTPADSALPRELVVDPGGAEKFRKYLPFPSFKTTIENYPYPYVIGRLCWEFPAAVPSDWEAFHLHGRTNALTVADWKSGLDATALKQGTFTMIFHPHGWIRTDQLTELVDYADHQYGKRVRFLNFREAQERLDRNLLLGQPVRAADGEDNGVRLLDLNNDGYLDVVIGNENLLRTRLWNPKQAAWIESSFPTALIAKDSAGHRLDAGVRFGVVSSNGLPCMIVRNETTTGAWQFDGQDWIADPELLNGLELQGQPVLTSVRGRDRGVRLRDINKDGVCELIVGNDSQNAVFQWSSLEKRWKLKAFGLPGGASIVDSEGRDNGLRFVDVNEDGFEDVLLSNAQSFSLYLYIPRPVLGFQTGWTREVVSGRRGDGFEIPMIVRDGPQRNNGAWFHSGAMWVQNEDTASNPDLVDRRSYRELLAGRLTPPKSPLESLQAIRVRPGFQVELVASEPLVKSPVAFDWSADGKLWVVEMVDYPLGLDGKGKPGGVVLYLEDTKGDGHYDKSTIFLDGLNFPNGIIPWRKGVLVSAPPDIIYAEDTDGDGKADKREVLFTGFREGNQQHRANGFDYGLDNWLYGANGDSGGLVRSILTGKSVNISHRDFRFRPDTGEFETQAGEAQFGRHRDDWGNWFANENAVGAWHYFLPEQYLVRNPHLSARSMKQTMPNYRDYTRVYPASRLAQRFNDPGTANHLTSANSTTPYRDELFGPDFATSYFVSEPVHNLVHREVLEPDGVSFSSHRASGEENTEFLASTDNWFRPTMTKTGPDGALYIADIYRQVIEHPEWIPLDFQRSVNLRAGEDMGRIYRVYPAGATLRKVPRLDQLDPSSLAGALESPNGWQRDTVQRLLVQSGDKAAVASLESLVARSRDPKVRLQALCTLDGMGALTQSLIMRALNDPHPGVREQAIRTGEPLLAKSDELGVALASLVHDPAIRVRYQLAFSLGEWPGVQAGRALAEIALNDLKDERMQLAVMSSAPRHVGEMLAALLEDRPQGTEHGKLIEQLVALAVLLGDNSALAKSLPSITRSTDGSYESWQFAAWNGLLSALDHRRMTLAQFESENKAALNGGASSLDAVLTAARQTAPRAQAPEETRIAAILLLGHSLDFNDASLDELAALLDPHNSQGIQTAALASLNQGRTTRAAELLVAAWQRASPGFRGRIVDSLLSRQEWIQVFLSAIENGQIPARAIGAARHQKLLNHSDPAVRARAGKLFGVASSDRGGVLKQYASIARLKGDPRKGLELFRQNCAPCHRFRGEGNEIGPDLATVAFKSIDYLLTAVLDPNQAFEERYTAYTAVTSNDQEYSGVITTESANSITLRLPGGSELAILRKDLKDLTSSGRSLMPEGFENSLNEQSLADLFSYITSAPPHKIFAGNKPETVLAGPDSSLSLLATNCRIFGDTLDFGEHFRNLGHWQSDNDRAVWSVEVARPGNYDVWLDWALPEGNHAVRLEAGGTVLLGTAAATGGWDQYRQARLGSIVLGAGLQMIEFRGEPPVNTDWLDLRELRLVPAGQAVSSAFRNKTEAAR